MGDEEIKANNLPPIPDDSSHLDETQLVSVPDLTPTQQLETVQTFPTDAQTEKMEPVREQDNLSDAADTMVISPDGKMKAPRNVLSGDDSYNKWLDEQLINIPEADRAKFILEATAFRTSLTGDGAANRAGAGVPDPKPY